MRADYHSNANPVQTSWSWKPRFTLADMCRDAWRFQQKNPDGYRPVI